jgi:hypothetical protein
VGVRIPESCEDNTAPAWEGLNARRYADTLADCNNLTALDQNSSVQLGGSVRGGIYSGVRYCDVLRMGDSNQACVGNKKAES